MDLRDYLRAIRRGWLIIVALVVIGLAAGVGLTLGTAKTYKSTAVIFVGAAPSTSGSQSGSNQLAQNLVSSFTRFATTPAVTTAVISDLGLSLTPGQLAGKITANAPANEVLIDITVTDGNAQRAAAIANSVATEFNNVVANSIPNSVLRLTTIAPATTPGSPTSPNPPLNIALGGVIGLILGIAIVAIRDVLDSSVTESRELDLLGLSALGVIPNDRKAKTAPLAFRGDPHGARAEAYRQLRTNLQFIDIDHAPRVIAVTSATAQEGKSSTALNIAAALAEAGNKVCLVEADLRRPVLASTLGLVGDIGLTTVLIGHIPLRDALQNAGRNLAVLTAGPVPPNPSELLLTELAGQTLREVAELADYTIIDTAPLLPVTDGAEAATLADATILVVRSGKTSREQVRRSVAALARVGRSPVGAVLNAVSLRSGYDREPSYYYTGEPEKARARHERNDRFVDLAYGNDASGRDLNAPVPAPAAAPATTGPGSGFAAQPPPAAPAGPAAPVEAPAAAAGPADLAPADSATPVTQSGSVEPPPGYQLPNGHATSNGGNGQFASANGGEPDPADTLGGAHRNGSGEAPSGLRGFLDRFGNDSQSQR